MARQTTAWRYGNKSRNGQKSKSKEKKMKFATQEQMSRGNYATYNTVKDVIVQEVQRKYKFGLDVAKSIRDGQRFDLSGVKPNRQVSDKTNGKQKKIEQDGYDIQYQEELRVFLDRKAIMKDNENKSYSLIFSNYCTRQMQQRIEERPEYGTKILDDPIKLLKQIKTLTHDTIRAEYPIASIVNHIARWVNSKQHEDENLLDYIKRSKYNRDIVKS